LLTNTTNISVNPPPDVHLLFGSAWGQANVSILWWIAVTAAAGIVLSRTAFGNWIYATGGDPVAARGAGVPTNLVKVVLFVATGVAAAFVGVIQGVEYHSGNATAGLGYVFQSIIVAVVGGVLLGGGYGSAFGVFLGTMIYGSSTSAYSTPGGARTGCSFSLAFSCSARCWPTATSAASP